MLDQCSSRSKRLRSGSIPVDNPVDDPDEDPTPMSLNISAAHEKVAQIAKLLKEWRWGFGTLVKHCLQGWSTRLARRLVEDAEVTYNEFKRHDLLVEGMEMATTFVVNGIRSELAALRDSSTIFGRWDPGLDFRQLDLSICHIKLLPKPVFAIKTRSSF